MNKTQKKRVVIAGAAGAAALAAAGVYFMTGKNAKNRKKVAKWVSGMQADVVRQLGKATKVTEKAYHKAVDAAAKNYKGLKNVSALELAAAAAELKNSWSTVRDEMGKAASTVKRIAPKAATSRSRKVAVKTAKKPAAKKRTTAKRSR